MSDLSLGAARYRISQSPLYLSRPILPFWQFSLPALYFSESLVVSMTDRAVWLQPLSFPRPAQSFSLRLSPPPQATRSRAACPSRSVLASAPAWRRWCAAATSIFTRCPKASPGTLPSCESPLLLFFFFSCQIFYTRGRSAL